MFHQTSDRHIYSRSSQSIIHIVEMYTITKDKLIDEPEDLNDVRGSNSVGYFQCGYPNCCNLQASKSSGRKLSLGGSEFRVFE